MPIDTSQKKSYLCSEKELAKLRIGLLRNNELINDDNLVFFIFEDIDG